MKDKTREQLATELEKMRRRIAELEKAKSRSKQAEEELKTKDDAMESSLSAIALSDIEGNLTYVNPSFLQMWGYVGEEEILGRPAIQFWQMEEQAAEIQKALLEKKDWFGELTALKADESTFKAQISASLITDEEGNPKGIVASIVDITERKRAEEALRDSEERFRTLIERSSDGITVIGADGNVLYESPSVERILGYGPDNWVGKPAFETIHPDDVSEVIKAYQFILDNPGESATVVIRIRHKDGSWHWMECTGRNLLEDTRVNGVVINYHDITERKRAEEALRESDERYQALFKRSLYSVYVHDFKGNFLDANDTALDMLGYTREEILSINFATLLDEEQIAKALKVLDEVKRTGSQKNNIEFKLRRKDGDYVWVETESASIFHGGKPYAVQGIAKDITERRRVEEELRESEERFRSLVENAPYVIFIADREGKILFANYTLEGFTVEDTVGTNVFDYVPAEHHEEMSRNINGVFESGEPAAYEIAGAGPDGTTSWYSTRVGPIKHDGHIIAVTLMVLDITERKRAQEALRGSEEKYRHLFEGASDGIFTMELTGEGAIFADCNSKALTLFGCNLEEIIGKSPLDFSPPVQPDGRPSEEKIKELAVAVMAGEPKFFEWSHRRLDGTTFEVEVALNWIEVGSGGYLQAIVRDITERKRAEEELKASEEKLHVMFESITDGIVVTDLRGIITDVNDVTAHMSGLSKEEMIGKDGFTMIPREDKDKIVSQGKKIVTGETGPVRMEHEVSGLGSESTTNLVLGTMHDSDGNPTGFVAIARDITERKQMEEERDRLLAELEDKSEELEQLVFIASHDLRSPLVNIQGFAREIEQSLQEIRLSLEEEDIPPTVKEKLAAPIGGDIADSLNYILTSSTKIDSMLAGLLNVSRLGRVSLTIEKINMKDLMAEVVDSFEFQTREAGVKLEVGRLPQCQGDRAQLNQAFSNLIDNALKYLDPKRPGIIRISGRKEGNKMVYTVGDNGLGIAPENQKTVFQIFRRFSPKDIPGEGLGLNIVRRILERHGGKIWLESEQGKGSRFHVALPIRD